MQKNAVQEETGKYMKYKKTPAFLILCATLILLTGCSSRQTAPQSQFYLLDGSTLSTESLKGRIWLLNFWATSCTTCVKEMPEFKKLYQEYQSKNIEIIAVAMSYDKPEYVRKFQQRKKLPFRIALDRNGKNAREWGDISLTPVTFLTDSSGNIVQTTVGKPDFQALRNTLDTLLKSEKH